LVTSCRILLCFFEDVTRFLDGIFAVFHQIFSSVLSDFLTASLQDFLNGKKEEWIHRLSICRPSVYIPISLGGLMCHVIRYNSNPRFLNFHLKSILNLDFYMNRNYFKKNLKCNIILNIVINWQNFTIFCWFQFDLKIIFLFFFHA